MRTITYRADENLKKVVIPIGFVGENEHTRVIFDCQKTFEEYPSAIASISVKPPVGDEYPSIVVHEGNYVYWDVTDADLTHKGLGGIQLTFMQGTKVCKTYIAGTLVEKSIMGAGAVPTALDDFIARASAAVTAIPDTINAALQAAKDSGEFDGADGFSPILTVEDILGGHRLTVQDEEGSFYVDIMDGINGQDGYSPTITVTSITNGHRLTITDKYGTRTVDIMDGAALQSFDYNKLYNRPVLNGTELVGTLSLGDIGAAELDANGKVKSSQLPSYVDDVVEYASLSAFPVTGESGKIYVALDTNLTYRWSGSAYVEISPSLALGETSSTAYRGDRGKSAYDVTEAISGATLDDIDKALSPKTVVNGRVTEWQFITGGSDIDVATLLETQAIIDEYTGPGGVVFETTFGYDEDSGSYYYETSANASDIAEAFMSGKSVMIHLPYAAPEGSGISNDIPEAYLSLVEYRPAGVDGNEYAFNEFFGISNAYLIEPEDSGLSVDVSSTTFINYIDVTEDGKLRIWIEILD